MKLNFDDLDIEQLVAFEGYEYKLSSGTSGLQLNVKTCPNCHNDNWKVYFNADSGLGNCFVCETGLNKFKFIKFARGFSANGDVYKYVKSYGDTLTYRPRTSTPTFTRVNKDWKLPLNMCIEKEEDLNPYLKDRGIDLKIAKRFDLRNCDNGFYTYENHHGKTAAVDFSARTIIPIRDIDGNLVTFQGRDITGSAAKKYLFPNMLPATGAFIYNANYALENNFKRVVLNEGVFDVYATTQALESDVTFNEYCAIGSFGKHLGIDRYNTASTDQLKDLYRLRENGLEEIVMLWDGEPKAVIAAMQTALKLENYGFTNVKVGILPAGCDPAETTKEEVLKAIREAKKVTQLSLVRYRMTNA
jgi:DNA primase